MKFNILLVDDNARFIESFKNILEFYFPERIENLYSAANGEECLAILKQNKIEIVFLDFDMPGLNGSEITRIINHTYRYIKVVGVSFHREQHILTKMILAGARSYLTKEDINRESLSRCLTGEYV